MIRSILLRAVSILGLISPAAAADIYTGGSLKEPPIIPVPTWAGFYLGVNGGGGWANDNHFNVDTFTTTGTDFRRISGTNDFSGGFGGGQLGYNWQFGSFVVGFETDIQGSDISGSARSVQVVGAVTRFGSDRVNIDWFGTVRGRLGWAFGPWLIYGTGGFAYAGVNDSFYFSDTAGNYGGVGISNTETGWTAGGGVEYKFNPVWSMKIEYQFIDLSTETRQRPLVLPVGYDLRGHSNIEFDTVRLGVNYHFVPAYEPLK